MQAPSFHWEMGREFVQFPCILAEQIDMRPGFREQRSDVRTEATTSMNSLNQRTLD